MQQFFAQKEQMDGDKITLTGEDVNHIKNVLRMKPGEEINIRFPGDEGEYRCGILRIEEERVECELRFVKENKVELPSKVTIFQALPKGDKMEWIIQKAVELGAYQIIPVAAHRCVVKLDGKKAAGKIARWQQIAKGAAQQSKRAIVPTVGDVLSFHEAATRASSMDVAWIPYELAQDMDMTRTQIAKLRPGQDIGFFIGPEGGFTKEEISLAVSLGIIPITLGGRILRTETAGLTLMAWIMYQLEGV
jgi:16S rRNA (uracil1498-N3)-methyltransferase